MAFSDLREFLQWLERRGEMRRIGIPVSPELEITEVCYRTLRNGGPALLFERPTGYDMPVLGNLFGSVERIVAALGRESISELREIGEVLAFLRQPGWSGQLDRIIETLPAFRGLLHVSPRVVREPPCAEVVLEGDDLDLSQLPVQTCWPGDAGPLITWGLVVTKGPRKDRQNIGIYRQQIIGRNRVIMRWLPHRGGALDYRDWREAHKGKRFPVAVAIGADPATLIAAVTPIPDSLSEYQFAGLLRGARTEVANCRGVPLQVPAAAEIVFEGYVDGEEAPEGPFGDHTGYYNSRRPFPIFTIERMTHRINPIYHSTYLGRSPHDEASVLAMVLNEVFIPLLQKQFPEITDFFLPPETCSYRVAVVSIRKQYAGHARQIMFGVWSYLRQFNYTKFIIVTDDDINIREWSEVMWAVSTRTDPARDTFIVDRTPMDYLDFASPVENLGSKMGIDATGKWPAETSRKWGETINMSTDVKQRIDAIWDELWS